jgi:chromosome segregation ATPase
VVLSGIVDPSARHDNPNHRESLQPLVRTLYKLASQAGRDNAARGQITSIVSQFVTFQQLQKPVLQAFENLAKTAAKYTEIEQEASALRASVGECDAIVEAAEARTSGAESRLAEALLAINEQRAQIAELAREREELSGLKATLAEREATLAEGSRCADELGLALQAAQVRLATNEAALQCAEQERTAAAAALEAELGAVREAQRAERSAHLEGAKVLEGEIAVLRDRLVAAEHEMQERATAATALRTEVAALQGMLGAARQVGKALSAACRIEASASTNKANESSRW